MSASSQSSRSDSSMEPADLNASQIWSDGHIKQIDSGEETGRTDMCDDEITEGTLQLRLRRGFYYQEAKSRHIVYTELRRDWTYMPVFWNCHDLAIRLAHIIVQPSMSVIRNLKSLMLSLQQAYREEIDWHGTADKACLGGWGAAAVGGAAAVPPLAFVGCCIFVAGWSIYFFGPSVHGWKSRKRYAFMIKLEERFPQLRSLHR